VRTRPKLVAATTHAYCGGSASGSAHGPAAPGPGLNRAPAAAASAASAASASTRRSSRNIVIPARLVDKFRWFICDQEIWLDTQSHRNERTLGHPTTVNNYRYGTKK
jgi:hypothetical protein